MLNVAEAEEEEQKSKVGTRSYFLDSSSCYIMDAKSMGNIGRYLNVSGLLLCVSFGWGGEGGGVVWLVIVIVVFLFNFFFWLNDKLLIM